jgi:hypothetical protein
VARAVSQPTTLIDEGFTASPDLANVQQPPRSVRHTDHRRPGGGHRRFPPRLRDGSDVIDTPTNFTTLETSQITSADTVAITWKAFQ